jgi:hypothetical protein
MRTLSRQLGPVLVVAAAAIAVVCWHRPPDGDAVWDPGRNSRAIKEHPWDEEHAARMRYLNWSYPVRVRVGRALLRGELSLWEAAACFRDLEAQRPPGLRAGSEVHRGATAEERHCRHVITFARAAFEEGSEVGDPAPRLEAELEERVRRGDLRLPGAPAGLVGRFDRGAR